MTNTRQHRSGQRADGRQNRERILEVARRVFDETSSATMQSIAREVGVGQGTLYRHFPTRGSLLVEVYQDEFDQLLTKAPKLLQQRPVDQALRMWLDELASLGRRKHALSEVLDAAARARLHDDQRRPLLESLEQLLAAGREAGSVRGSASAEDVLALVSFLWHLELDGDTVTRLLDMVSDGLRPSSDAAAEGVRSAAVMR